MENDAPGMATAGQKEAIVEDVRLADVGQEI